MFISTSEQQTLKFASNFAKKLRGGEVLALVGELGAGKTVFVKGLAKGLGIKENVLSPTFLLMKCYLSKKNKKHLCHIDAYRLESADELIDIGVLEHLKKRNTITVIEWADRVKDLFKSINYIEIKIEHGEKENERVVEISNI